jgi:hypothetical protein
VGKENFENLLFRKLQMTTAISARSKYLEFDEHDGQANGSAVCIHLSYVYGAVDG